MQGWGWGAESDASRADFHGSWQVQAGLVTTDSDRVSSLGLAGLAQCLIERFCVLLSKPPLFMCVSCLALEGIYLNLESLLSGSELRVASLDNSGIY